MRGNYLNAEQQRCCVKINACFHSHFKCSIKTVCHKIKLYAITINIHKIAKSTDCRTIFASDKNKMRIKKSF